MTCFRSSTARRGGCSRNSRPDFLDTLCMAVRMAYCHRVKRAGTYGFNLSKTISCLHQLFPDVRPVSGHNSLLHILVMHDKFLVWAESLGCRLADEIHCQRLFRIGFHCGFQICGNKHCYAREQIGRFTAFGLNSTFSGNDVDDLLLAF